ncbi:hypothetical protein D9758_012605 [Tetrapyrgos nigripes]|uniref:Uncharacterized protein n=1 Tax=Tetrapyrgos nigripes TaxID=182062 RepID=A0A8H5GDR1_9AGAR|nr:hypothetical protein D9758_012605 [Tetrapyrgos nigripes]
MVLLAIMEVLGRKRKRRSRESWYARQNLSSTSILHTMHDSFPFMKTNRSKSKISPDLKGGPLGGGSRQRVVLFPITYVAQEILGLRYIRCESWHSNVLSQVAQSTPCLWARFGVGNFSESPLAKLVQTNDGASWGGRVKIGLGGDVVYNVELVAFERGNVGFCRRVLNGYLNGGPRNQTERANYPPHRNAYALTYAYPGTNFHSHVVSMHARRPKEVIIPSSSPATASSTPSWRNRSPCNQARNGDVIDIDIHHTE